MYTSGTTGLPKGALHTHDSVEWAVLTVLATADVRFLDRYLICLPLFHVGALNPLTVTIYRGGTVILMRQFDPERIWTIFRDEHVTVTLAVPAMLNFMLQTYRPDVHQPLQLRWIMSGASPVPPSLIEEYARLGLEIHQVYGLTETCGPACLISPDEALTTHRLDREERSSTPTSASSTTTAPMSASTSPARSSSAAGTSWPATGTAPTRPRRRSRTVGCTPATSRSSTPTASSSSGTGSRT